MARKRGKQTGYLIRKGPSWIGYWNVFERDDHGIERWLKHNKVICDSKKTKKQAQGEFDRQVLNALAAASMHSESRVTLAQFWASRFEPMLHKARRKNTRTQYASLWRRHIAPALGAQQMRNIKRDHVQKLVWKSAETLSSQTVEHIRKVVSSIFEYAITIEFSETNPAHRIEVPKRKSVRRNLAYTYEQARMILQRLDGTVREMVRMSMCTSLNVAELCGLHWKHVNLTRKFQMVDGEAIPPMRAAVRFNYTASELGDVKTGNRYRTVPLPANVALALSELRRRADWAGSDDFVFCNKRGGPIDAHNVSNRVFRKLSAKPTEENPLGLGFKVNWHSFRHTAATWAEMEGMIASDRQALLGHGSMGMTGRYTHEDLERQRGAVERIATALEPDSETKKEAVN